MKIETRNFLGDRLSSISDIYRLIDIDYIDYWFSSIGQAHSRPQSLRSFWPAAGTFSSPEAALLLVSTKNRDLWPSATTEVSDSRTSRHSAHAQSQV